MNYILISTMSSIDFDLNLCSFYSLFIKKVGFVAYINATSFVICLCLYSSKSESSIVIIF